MKEIMKKIDELKEIIGDFSAKNGKTIVLKINAEAEIDSESEVRSDFSDVAISRKYKSKISSSIRIDDYEEK